MVFARRSLKQVTRPSSRARGDGRRSNRHHALGQILRTNDREYKLRTAHSVFNAAGMMEGTTASYTVKMLNGEAPQPRVLDAANEDNETDEHGAMIGQRVMSSIELAIKRSRLI